MLSFECIKNEKSVYFLLTSAKTAPRQKLMGSTRARIVPVAQRWSKKLPAREVIGQQSPAPRRSCPKQAGKHHREEVYWAAQEPEA